MPCDGFPNGHADDGENAQDPDPHAPFFELGATADEIIAFCRERMAVYKAPRSIEFRSELPKTAVGKVLRRELRD